MPELDYFRYFPASFENQAWGLSVVAAGYTRVAKGASYPPEGHPSDHHFSWAHGRVLDNLQILLIRSGTGILETRHNGVQRLEAGMAFLILPKTWHRYRPDPATGWVESWIEIEGPVVSRLVAERTFTIENILRPGALAAGLDEVMDSIHRSSIKGGQVFLPELSALALQALAICAKPKPSASPSPRIDQIVREAEHYLSEHHSEPVNLEELARNLGTAYSHFRRAFRAQTGFSPWQYVVHLRLMRAKRLMASSDATLEAVAERTGFTSGFHLSLAFKKAFGQSPTAWKKSLQGGPSTE